MDRFMLAVGRRCTTAASSLDLLPVLHRAERTHFRCLASQGPTGSGSAKRNPPPSQRQPSKPGGARSRTTPASPPAPAPAPSKLLASQPPPAPRPRPVQQSDSALSTEAPSPSRPSNPAAAQPEEASAAGAPHTAATTVETAATAPPAAPAAPSPGTTADAEAGLSPGILERYDLSPRQHQQLDTYLSYMLEVNQSMNLTAVREKGDAWQRHVVDSLALLPVIERHVAAAAAAVAVAAAKRTPSPASAEAPAAASGTPTAAAEAPSSSGRGSSGRRGGGGGGGGGGGATGMAAATAGLRVVDVGTGAGLPGMVLAVARPLWKITLLDSLRKRCEFLREAAARSGLSNVEVVWCRAEEGGHKTELRQAYDVAVARAVAEARVLSELCLPFVRVGGVWVAAKGPDPEEEVAAAGPAIRQLGGRPLALERVESYSTEGQRTALVVAKVAPTPARYPRQPGTPSKKPL